MRLTEKLLGYLPRVFNTDADRFIAMRLRSPGGLRWEVEDGVLSVVASGVPLRFELADFTLATLADALLRAGVEVPGVATSSHLSALVLLDGAGNQDESNGDRLYGFRDILRAYMEPVSVELKEASRQISNMTPQMSAATAEGIWLEEWGDYFGVPRGLRSDDDDYRGFMIAEVLRPRNNRFAIEKAILDLTGKKVELYEPLRDLIALDFSRLDSEARMFDGDEWATHVFRPVVRGPKTIVWDDVLAVIDQCRLAGVRVLAPEWIPDVVGLHLADGSAASVAYTDHFMRRVFFSLAQTLDSARLDIDSTDQTYSFLVRDLRTSMFSMLSSDETTWGGTWDSRKWRNETPAIPTFTYAPLMPPVVTVEFGQQQLCSSSVYSGSIGQLIPEPVFRTWDSGTWATGVWASSGIKISTY